MPQPSNPPASDPYTNGYKIIDQRQDASGNVLVTFALPGMKTATIRMPYAAWVEGHAHSIGSSLVRLAAGGAVNYEAGET